MAWHLKNDVWVRFRNLETSSTTPLITRKEGLARRNLVLPDVELSLDLGFHGSVPLPNLELWVELQIQPSPSDSDISLTHNATRSIGNPSKRPRQPTCIPSNGDLLVEAGGESDSRLEKRLSSVFEHSETPHEDIREGLQGLSNTVSRCRSDEGHLQSYAAELDGKSVSDFSLLRKGTQRNGNQFEEAGRMPDKIGSQSRLDNLASGDEDCGIDDGQEPSSIDPLIGRANSQGAAQEGCCLEAAKESQRLQPPGQIRDEESRRDESSGLHREQEPFIHGNSFHSINDEKIDVLCNALPGKDSDREYENGSGLQQDCLAWCWSDWGQPLPPEEDYDVEVDTLTEGNPILMKPCPFSGVKTYVDPNFGEEENKGRSIPRMESSEAESECHHGRKYSDGDVSSVPRFHSDKDFADMSAACQLLNLRNEVDCATNKMDFTMEYSGSRSCGVDQGSCNGTNGYNPSHELERLSALVEKLYADLPKLSHRGRGSRGKVGIWSVEVLKDSGKLRLRRIKSCTSKRIQSSNTDSKSRGMKPLSKCGSFQGLPDSDVDLEREVLARPSRKRLYKSLRELLS